MQRRVISRHIVSLCEDRKSVSVSLFLLPLSHSFSFFLHGIDANRHGIDSRPSVKLILLPSAPSDSTTSRKISWEPKGASLLLRRSSGLWAVLLPSSRRRPLRILFLSLSLSFIPEEARFRLAWLPGAAVCFSESGPTVCASSAPYHRSIRFVPRPRVPVASRHGRHDIPSSGRSAIL